MNKFDLIMALAEKEDLTEKDAKTIINLIFDGFTKALEDSGRIEIRGLGSFSVRNYKSYGGRSPKTGGKIDVKPKRMAFLKVGKNLKKRVNVS